MPKNDREIFSTLGQKVLPEFYTHESLLLQCRLLMTIGYFPELLTVNPVVFSKALDYFLKCFSADVNKSALARLALDTFNTLLEDEDCKEIIGEHLPDFVQKLLAVIDKYPNKEYYGIISTIISGYPASLISIVVELTEFMVAKCATVEESWTVLENICRSDKLRQDYSYFIESALMPLFNLLGDSSATKTHSKLYELATYLLKDKSSLSENMLKVLALLLETYPLHVSKTEFIDLLILFISAGREEEPVKTVHLGKLLEVANFFLKELVDFACEPSQRLKYCQMLIKCMREYVPMEVVASQFRTIIRRIEIAINHKEAVSVCLSNTLLVYVVYFPAVALNVMKEDSREGLLTMVIVNKRDKEKKPSVYSKKILSFAIMEVIRQEKLSESMEDICPFLFNVLVDVMSGQRTHQIRGFWGDQSESESSESMSEGEDEKERGNVENDVLTKEFLDMDEHEYLRETVKMVSTKNPTRNSLMIKGLPAEKSEVLLKLLRTYELKIKGKRVNRVILKPRYTNMTN